MGLKTQLMNFSEYFNLAAEYELFSKKMLTKDESTPVLQEQMKIVMRMYALTLTYEDETNEAFWTSEKLRLDAILTQLSDNAWNIENE